MYLSSGVGWVLDLGAGKGQNHVLDAVRAIRDVLLCGNVYVCQPGFTGRLVHPLILLLLLYCAINRVIFPQKALPCRALLQRANSIRIFQETWLLPVKDPPLQSSVSTSKICHVLLSCFASQISSTLRM